jgi:hypothetical protein
MVAANNSRAAELFDTASPYLLELLQSAPQFGTAGITFIFHDGIITRVDVSASVQRKTEARV